MTTHSYTVCEQRYDQYDQMPCDDSRMSGRVGCTGTRGTLFFRHDPLEEELDPCLSAAVRYNKEKGTGCLRTVKYCLCCIIVLLAIALLMVALLMIFGYTIKPASSPDRISKVNDHGSAATFISQSQVDVDESTGMTESQIKTTEQVDELHIRSGLPEKQIIASSPLPPPTIPMVRPTPRPRPPAPPPQPPPPVVRVPFKPKPVPTPPKPAVITTRKTTTTTTTTSKPTTTIKAAIPTPARPVGGPRHNIQDCDYHRKMGRKSGVQKLSVPNYEFYAYCEMESGHGWVVLQRRTGEDQWPFWNQTFDQYADGFGVPDKDHWLGLERMVKLANGHKMEMRIRLRGDFCKSKACSGLGSEGSWWGDWEFTIGDRSDAYPINDLQYMRGNLSDTTNPEKEVFRFLCNGMKFTTIDADNDMNEQGNCAEINQRGAWWHRDCAFTAPNGKYGISNGRPHGFYWLWKPPTENVTHRSYVIKPQQSSILFRVPQ